METLCPYHQLDYHTLWYNARLNLIFFSQENELDRYSLPESIEIPSSPSHDFLSETLLYVEVILKAMMLSKQPWKDHHHWSSIIPMVSTINTIPSLSRQSLGSNDPWVVPSPTSSSLPVSQDLTPLHSSSIAEHIPTTNHTFLRKKKKWGRHRKRKPNKKAPASRYHVGHHLPSTSGNHDGGNVPISIHCDGAKLANGYLVGT